MNKVDSILLVDDDHPTNFYNSIIIEDLDCANNVMFMQSAQEALDYLQMGFDNKDFVRPNLLFLDINMPGMNGWEFLEELAEMKTEQYDVSEIVIIILSSSLNPDDRTKAITNPFVKDFMNKPLSEECLMHVMNTYFNNV